MKPWLIQSSGLILGTREARLLAALKNQNVEVFDFGVLPFTNQITGTSFAEVSEVSFVHCSTKALQLIKTRKAMYDDRLNSADVQRLFEAKIFYDFEAFDFAVYSQHADLKANKLLLNHDARVFKIKDVQDHLFEYEVFCKPTKDLKLFNGTIIEPGYSLLMKLAGGMMDSSYHRMVKAGETLLIAPPKEVQDEFRFFVVDGEVVSSSKYMSCGTLSTSPTIEPRVLAAAVDYAKVYQPARVFVMDLCTLPSGEIKIVEYNCANCSGVYDVNLEPLIERLEALS
jgi:hypothetical protein